MARKRRKKKYTAKTVGKDGIALKNAVVIQKRGKYAVVLKTDKRGRARKVARVKL
jgi:hypothetical protein